jgi:hypothetical protein
MRKIFNQVAKIVEDNLGENKTVILNEFKLRFTEKSVIVYSIDVTDGSWFKEITINADMYSHQIVNLIIQIIKLFSM